MPAFGPTPLGIKSTQRGTIAMNGTTTGTSTITPVNTGKTELRNLGAIASSASALDAAVYLVLTDNKTVTATRVGNTGTTTVSWEITEFY